jgi:hypothetical protein
MARNENNARLQIIYARNLLAECLVITDPAELDELISELVASVHAIGSHLDAPSYR